MKGAGDTGGEIDKKSVEKNSENAYIYTQYRTHTGGVVMSYSDWRIFVGAGGFFILLGIIGIIWGKREETSYYASISQRADVKEFVNHSPLRPEPGALKTGGWICIALGIIMLAASGFWYWQLLKP